MKKISLYQSRLGLVWGIFLTYFGLQISCTPENPNDRNVQVILQIPLPGNGGLKNATSITGVRSVMLTITSGNEILTSKELTISGNAANGTVSIMPGKNIKFTAEASDEKNIVQWQGSTTVDIDDDFTVDIELTPIPPSAINLLAQQKGQTINLSWTQVSDPDFLRYDLYRSISQNLLGTIIYSTNVATLKDYADSKVSAGNNYYYTLFATDTEGFNTKSNVFKIILVPPPTASKLQQEDGGFNSSTDFYEAALSWTQNFDPYFARYELYRSFAENIVGTLIFSTTDVTKRDYADLKLTVNSTYYYRLFVFDTFGSATVSNVLVIAVLD